MYIEDRPDLKVVYSVDTTREAVVLKFELYVSQLPG